MGLGFVPARCSASCKIQAAGFLPKKDRRGAGRSFWDPELGSTGVESHDSSCSPMRRAWEGRWRAQIQGNVGQTQGIRSSY